MIMIVERLLNGITLILPKTCSVFIPGKITTEYNILSTNSSRNVGFHIVTFYFVHYCNKIITLIAVISCSTKDALFISSCMGWGWGIVIT